MYPIPSTQGDSWNTNFRRLPSSALQEGPPATNYTNTPLRSTHPQDQLQYSIGFSTCPNPGPTDIIRGRQIGQIRVLPWTSDQDPKSGFLFQAFE